MFRPPHRFCTLCSYRLLSIFANELASPANLIRASGKLLLQSKLKGYRASKPRAFGTRNVFKASVGEIKSGDNDGAKSLAQMEAVVRLARQLFGESLPEDFLSREEYLIYERLYGPPSATTISEDVESLLMGMTINETGEAEIPDGGAVLPQNVLLREDREGNLEEVMSQDHVEVDTELVEGVSNQETQVFEEESALSEAIVEERSFPDAAEGDSMEGPGLSEPLEQVDRPIMVDRVIQDDLKARLIALGEQIATQRKERELWQAKVQQSHEDETDEPAAEDAFEEAEGEEEASGVIEDELGNYESGTIVRGHPMTKRGRFGTSPSTIQLPKASLVEPSSALFADSSNKQLREVAQKTFGGKGLPNSTATIIRPNLRQATIPLEASQGQMGEMEANAYLAAIYPGAYASAMSVLAEVRKRLGSEWLRSLMAQPQGPRVLDAGSGGAAVLAWREVIKVEYDSISSDSSVESQQQPPPFGKSTVVTGSHTLRKRASSLLDDTTFIPRLPDYDPSRDHPSLESSNPQPRKQYDIIIAPYTLWSLKEDHMRKSQIQNFWSLLSPNGGVLILIEKGVPRGFELIAGARETLLQHHISSPGAESPAVDSANPNRFTHKEAGMIIAPCTNHGKCPMYVTAGKAQGRKDFCRFNQRFIRPPYLQRILGENDTNHEDISFSYVAFQRGKDLRTDESFVQGSNAADAAFEGYEEIDADTLNNKDPGSKPPHSLALPRAILPPIKRHGHVILDLCTPAATIERWTVSRSFSKQAYRDARKSKWGDLWALGAKTRVRRNIRVGMIKQREEQEMLENEEGQEEEEADGEDDLSKEMGGANMMEGWTGKRKKSGFKEKGMAKDKKGRRARAKKSRADEDDFALG